MLLEIIIIMINIKAFMTNIVDFWFKFMSRLVNPAGLTWIPSVNTAR